MGACTMGLLRISVRVLGLLLILVLLGSSALAQSPTYGVGRTPTQEEIRAWDISISPTGEELPPGHGTAEEGELVYRRQGCAGCHGATLTDGRADRLLKRQAEARCRPLELGTNTADPLAVRDDGMGLHQSRDASQPRGNPHRR